MDEMPYRPFDWYPGFYRKPSWRWIRAGYLVESRRRRDPRIDDDWVALARLVQRPSGRWPTAEKEKCSAIAAAFELWQHGPCLQRSRMEAYLLTSVPFERIATICGLDPAIVEAYHAVFFDVRSMVSATDWLLSQAIGLRRAFNPDVPELDRVWKYFAFTGGESVLEIVIAVTAGTKLPNWLTDTFTNPAFDEARLRLKVKLSILAVANTPKQWMAISAIRKRLRRIEGVVADESNGDNLLIAMKSFLAVAPRLPSISPDEEPRSTGVSLIADEVDQRDVSTQRHRPLVSLVDDERAITTDLPETPVELLELHRHSWRSLDEDPDTADGIDVGRGRCRVLIAAS